MFTGIVERTGLVVSALDRSGGLRLGIRPGKVEGAPPWQDVALGESIAVNGVCLTVAHTVPGGLEVAFDVVPETLEKTALGTLRAGDSVNLERSLRVGDRFGGHYVTGHVDGVGRVQSRRAVGDQVLFEIAAPAALLRQMIPKGSIAVDGISLTLIEVDRRAEHFSFAAIPHTLARTTLADRTAGSTVNLETDAFGKWVLHSLEADSLGATSLDASGDLTQTLERAGFKRP